MAKKDWEQRNLYVRKAKDCQRSVGNEIEHLRKKELEKDKKPSKGLKLQAQEAYASGGIKAVIEFLEKHKDPNTGRCLYQREIVEKWIRDKYPEFEWNIQANPVSEQTVGGGDEQGVDDGDEHDR